MCIRDSFEINGDELKVVSLDGHRISIRKIQLKNAYTPKKVVIPGKTLNDISKILSGETDRDVSIFFTDNHVVFEFDSTTVVSRLIEGEYFRIDQMLSSDYETKVTINKKAVSYTHLDVYKRQYHRNIVPAERLQKTLLCQNRFQI